MLLALICRGFNMQGIIIVSLVTGTLKPLLMAKRAKTAARKKRAPARKKSKGKTKRSSNISKPEPALPPKKRAIALRKLKKLTVRPSRPTKGLGPTLDLSFDAPIKRFVQKKKPKAKAKKTKKKG
jgi:hypothetical protein